jgi:thioredoxin-related protein
MRKGLLITMCLLLNLNGLLTAQVQPLPIEKTDSIMARSPKPLLILLSTEWCKYCQMQKVQLSKNKDFQAQKKLFHFIEFDAESKKTINFQGKSYTFKPTGISTGTHELAIALNGPDQLSFPTWVLLDTDYQVLFRHNGILTYQQMEKLLKAIQLYAHSSNDN